MPESRPDGPQRSDPLPPILAGDVDDASRHDPHSRRLAWLAGAPLIEGRRFGGLPGLAGVLAGGLRATALMPVRPGAIPTQARWSILLVAFVLATAILGDALILGPSATEFNTWALRAGGFDLALIVLGSTWLAERPRRKSSPIPRFDPVPVSAPVSAPAAAGAAQVDAPPRPDPRPDPDPRPEREPVPPLHFATVVLSASFCVLLASYVITIVVDRQAVEGEPFWVPGIWFYTWTMIWPWWVAVRAVQYQHRYQAIPLRRRLLVLLALGTSIAWALIDPGEPFWVFPEPLEAERYTVLDLPAQS